MRQAEFAELSREVMPVLDKLTEIAGQHGTAEKLVSITLSAESNQRDTGNRSEETGGNHGKPQQQICEGGRCVMNREGRTVNVKDWGRLGAKRVVLYEDRGELRFTDGFHDMRMTQARMEAFVPGGDAVLADVYRRVRGTRSWHPVVKELKKLLDEIGEKRYED